MVAAAVHLEAYRLDAAGAVKPGKPEAIALANFLPRAFVKALAQAAADAETNPAAKTVAYVRGLGATSFDAALGLNVGMGSELAEAVQGEVSEMEKNWARTAERLGLPGAKIDEVL
jgi:hypothetical protein